MANPFSQVTPEISGLSALCESNSTIDPTLYAKYDVKRGLRDINGKDPRANVFKKFVESLSKEKNRSEEFQLYSLVERRAVEIIADKRRIYKGVSANVDFYSGFVYNMLDLPIQLYTPLFAIARIAGWAAHRMEEIINANKIIRPAYKGVLDYREYIPLKNRQMAAFAIKNDIMTSSLSHSAGDRK